MIRPICSRFVVSGAVSWPEKGPNRPNYRQDVLPGRTVVPEHRKTLFFLEVRDPSLSTNPHLTEKGGLIREIPDSFFHSVGIDILNVMKCR